MTFKIWGTEEVVRQVSGVSVDRSSMTMLPNGGYVVTWRESSSPTKICFQLYGGDGVKIGDVQVVDSASTNNQRFADVQAVGPDGSFVVTWSEFNGLANREDVFARKFSVTGEPESNVISVGVGADTQDNPAVGTGSNGGWATVYSDHVQIKLVRYSENGTAAPTITITDISAAYNPDVAYLGGDKYVVAYGANNNIRFQIVDNGIAGPETTVFGGTLADVVALKTPDGTPNGQFAIVTNNGSTILARIYSADGVPSAPITITTNAPNSGFDYTSVTALREGGFALV